MNNFIISYGNSVFNTQMSTSTLNDVIARTKSDLRIAETIKNVRSISDKKERSKYKTANLPFFNLGTFQDDKRKTEYFLSSEFMIVDIDNLDDQQLEEVKNKLQNDNRVFIYFLSPSGNGYKVVYRFSEPITNSKKFSENYKYYAEQLSVDYGVETDKTSDSARACFFSHDPNLYLNENAELLEVKEFIETIDFTAITTDEEKFLPSAVEYLREHIDSYDDWRRAGMALSTLGERGRSYFQQLSSNPRYKDTTEDIDKKFDNFLQTASGKIQIATLFDIAKKHGFSYSTKEQPTTA
ncbi:MAG: PriCT-2 domain-containing protein, partial [Flavobacteriales bacterium]|nr:PriCT-2 domain-containing protein [Flavobacteriales bacterium]